MFRGEQLRIGVALEYGSIEETMAFSAWSRNRILMLQAVKAIAFAPIEAARSEGSPDTTIKAFNGFAQDLWPELEAHREAVLERQRALLRKVGDRPIRLTMDEGSGGTLSVTMDPL